jgi:hypothetical protein
VKLRSIVLCREVAERDDSGYDLLGTISGLSIRTEQIGGSKLLGWPLHLYLLIDREESMGAHRVDFLVVGPAPHKGVVSRIENVPLWARRIPEEKISELVVPATIALPPLPGVYEIGVAIDGQFVGAIALGLIQVPAPNERAH